MSALTLIDGEIAELRWAASYYWKKGRRAEARKCYHEIQGLRRAKAIVERSADFMERYVAYSDEAAGWAS
jgi:hypothetical protein